MMFLSRLGAFGLFTSLLLGGLLIFVNVKQGDEYRVKLDDLVICIIFSFIPIFNILLSIFIAIDLFSVLSKMDIVFKNKGGKK